MFAGGLLLPPGLGLDFLESGHLERCQRYSTHSRGPRVREKGLECSQDEDGEGDGTWIFIMMDVLADTGRAGAQGVVGSLLAC